MELHISLIVCLHMYVRVNNAEWVEISQFPSESSSKSSIKWKHINDNTTIVSDNIQDVKNENIFERSRLSFADEETIDVSTDTNIVNMENSSSEKKSYFGFLNFIENIQNVLIKNTRQSINSKIGLLQELKYSLLFNIKDKIDSLWKPVSKREARGYYDKSDDSQMDFPSNEGALMTIGFLTFAVFLIKLVLKLIYALKYKNNGTTGNVTPVLVGRKKRHVFDEEAIKILRLIDEYKLT